MPRPSLISSDGNGCAEQTFLPGVTLPGSLPRDSAASMAELRLLTLAFAVTMVLAMGIFLLHRRIKRRIEQIWSL
jgi:predicted cobalt transporter CbtA